jgi:putative DNA primase/helicase
MMRGGSVDSDKFNSAVPGPEFARKLEEDFRSFGFNSQNDVEDSDQLFQELVKKYSSAICTSKDLESLNIPARQRLMGEWMREGDLGFVFGERGSGKTWFVDAVATHLSAGRQLAEWSVPTPVDVLLVDGEMPLDATRDRLRGMSPNNPRLHVLHHERLCDQSGVAMNLANPRTQQVVTHICIEKSIKLLVLDNLSCLFSGIKENDAVAWELVLVWLLALRRRRIAVPIVDYAIRTGTVRCTSNIKEIGLKID